METLMLGLKIFIGLLSLINIFNTGIYKSLFYYLLVLSIIVLMLIQGKVIYSFFVILLFFIVEFVLRLNQESQKVISSKIRFETKALISLGFSCVILFSTLFFIKKDQIDLKALTIEMAMPDFVYSSTLLTIIFVLWFLSMKGVSKWK